MVSIGKAIRCSTLFTLFFLLSACASSPPKPQVNEPWMHELLNYEQSLGPNHKDSVKNIFQVSPEIQATVKEKFSRLPKLRAARKLAMWLVDKEGKGMEYDIDANLTPNNTYQQNRGNCLSFTLLLTQLASEIGVSLKVNEVDVPDSWGQNGESDLIFYRHVNAVLKTNHHTEIFDLALEQYGPGYPQRFIDKRKAAALLFSNMGIQYLQNLEYEQALHYLSLAVSINPNSTDLWVNLGAVLKRTEQLQKAEQAYLYAFSLNNRDGIAASNLERLYRVQNKNRLADKYKKLANSGRQKNPYLHFKTASQAYADRNYKAAKKSIKRAIRLYNQDPEFFELRSKLRQVEKKYIAALRDLEKAQNLSKGVKEKGRYASKADRVFAQAKEQLEERRLRRPRSQISINRTQVDALIRAQ